METTPSMNTDINEKILPIGYISFSKFINLFSNYFCSEDFNLEKFNFILIFKEKKQVDFQTNSSSTQVISGSNKSWIYNFDLIEIIDNENKLILDEIADFKNLAGIYFTENKGKNLFNTFKKGFFSIGQVEYAGNFSGNNFYSFYCFYTDPSDFAGFCDIYETRKQKIMINGIRIGGTIKFGISPPNTKKIPK